MARLLASCLTAGAFMAAGLAAFGQAPADDKSQYTIFRPTPFALLRELSADRPDTTESPITVDAGHFQFELSFVEWRTGGDGEEFALLPTNFKVGLNNFMDAQFVFNPYLRSVAGGGTDAGHGDTQVRLKVNLWGNDGGEGFFGETALAIMPFIQLPTGADAFSNDDHLEWGIIAPFSLPLPAEFGLTLMAEVDWVRNDSDGYDTIFVHSAALGRDIQGPLAGYIEYIGVAAIDGDDDYQATLGMGLTWSLNDNCMLDGGIDVGLNSAAADLRLFLGMTYRM